MGRSRWGGWGISKWVFFMLFLFGVFWVGASCGRAVVQDLTGMFSRGEEPAEVVVLPAPMPTVETLPTLPPPLSAPALAAAGLVVEPAGPAGSALVGSQDGICYRTPEVQQWIVEQLGVELCRYITEPELFRITADFDVPQERRGNGVKALAQPGDLRGLASVKSLRIRGHCRDWSDPDLVAGVLAGFNPAGDVAIETAVDFGSYEDPTPDWTRDEVARGKTAEAVAGVRMGLVQRALETDSGELVQALYNLQQGPFGMNEEQAMAWRRQIYDIIGDLESRAEDIGRAVAAARGDELVRFGEPERGTGKAALSWQPAEEGFGEVTARVELRQTVAMADDCG